MSASPASQKKSFSSRGARANIPKADVARGQWVLGRGIKKEGGKRGKKLLL